MEEPVPEALAVTMARGQIETFDLTRVIYYTGHERSPVRAPGLPRWREALFALMHHNAQRPGAYFKIPGGQIMEIGVEFEIWARHDWMGGFGNERCFEMDRPTKMPSAPFSPRGGWDQLAAGDLRYRVSRGRRQPPAGMRK